VAQDRRIFGQLDRAFAIGHAARMSEETPVQTVRRLLRAVPDGALGTLLRESGAPYVSMVSVATDHDGAPLLLLSDLADHTRNLRADERASLLLEDTGGREDPLAGERVTLQGRLRPSALTRHRERYLARQPKACMYADFKDFAFYHLTLERAHLVAGFGRIRWLDGAEVLLAPQPALMEQEPGLIEHMNGDHRDAIQLYARHLLGEDSDGWQMTGIDPEGCDLRLGARVARLSFGQAVADAEGARAELVRLVKKARALTAAAS
jgi:heme iron utilization protein